MSIKNTIDTCQKMASYREGRYLSDLYINNKTKYKWACKFGHIFHMAAQNVTNGQWCPKCSGKERHNLDWLKALAIKNEGECLSNRYINTMTKYKWKCKKGHQWMAAANGIRQGKWCLYCSGKAKHNLEWLYNLAKVKNGVCLSEVYINVGSYYEWKCKFGHQWKAKAQDIKQGSWCPFCFRNKSAVELEIFDYVKSMFLDTISGKRSILETKQFELDIYIPSLNKAIEYDGPYHDPKHCLYRIGTKEKDFRKNQECKNKGIDLLRISYKEYDGQKGDKEAVFNKISNFLNG